MIETLKIGTLKWHHILNPTDENLEYLKANFHFHPLDIEDCRSDLNQRPKLDIYDDYYFMILHFPNYDRQNKFLRVKEVKIFWGIDYVITIGKSHWVVAEMFKEGKDQETRGEEFEVGTSDQLLYYILERLMKSTQRIIKTMGDDVDAINRNLFNIRAEKTIEKISEIRKNMILLNTMFKPQLPLFGRFESGQIEGFADNMEDYWGNILDYYRRMYDLTEDYAELIEGLSQTFDSLQANRTNEIIKILTLISSILLPLTFLTGLYGMNVKLPLQNDPRSFWLVIGAMMVIALFMLFLFKRKKWM
ncbi:MAG: magnesium transporter CorA family protein [Bacteroidales bacterium]|nr:magnesium transporter CorA family protein [Bacteroidales bacterium]MCF8403299.1 magnesium transporter CorA family protein [Bacteroidales bacterium]